MLKKIIKRVLIYLFLISAAFFVFFFIGKTPRAKTVIWGVNFSQEYATGLGLNWKEVYLALVHDVGAKNIKISVQWNIVEPEEGKYSFDDLEWQIKAAEDRGIKVVPVIGIKTSRWPECHIPGWATALKKEQQQERILEMIKAIVLRYQYSPAIKYWQVENEPFFPFGECPWTDKEFLKKEVALVKDTDLYKHPVLITDSGEWSTWINAARTGDLVGSTLYRKVWMEKLGLYRQYWFTPMYYSRKAQLIDKLFHKKVICAELQAEPWGPGWPSEMSFAEQAKTMDLKRFRDNVIFAENTGFDEFYLWGGEWWFWAKQNNHPEIWEEAKKLFQDGTLIIPKTADK